MTSIFYDGYKDKDKRVKIKKKKIEKKRHSICARNNLSIKSHQSFFEAARSTVSDIEWHISLYIHVRPATG